MGRIKHAKCAGEFSSCGKRELTNILMSENATNVVECRNGKGIVSEGSFWTWGGWNWEKKLSVATCVQTDGVHGLALSAGDRWDVTKFRYIPKISRRRWSQPPSGCSSSRPWLRVPVHKRYDCGLVVSGRTSWTPASTVSSSRTTPP